MLLRYLFLYQFVICSFKNMLYYIEHIHVCCNFVYLLIRINIQPKIQITWRYTYFMKITKNVIPLRKDNLFLEN